MNFPNVPQTLSQSNWQEYDVRCHGSGANGIRKLNFETNALLLKAETQEIDSKKTLYFDWLNVCW